MSGPPAAIQPRHAACSLPLVSDRETYLQMNSSAVAPLACLFAMSAVANAAPADGHVWKTYDNSRYGFEACYPADLFHPGAEPDAHDGIAYSGPAGTSLTTAAINDIDHQTPAKEALDEFQAAAGADAQITYKASKADWAVVSGSGGGKVVYVRRVVRRGVSAGFSLMYPAADQARYASIVRRMNGCFVLSR